MQFCVFGASGICGYFGVQLAEAREDVLFDARGPHPKALLREAFLSKVLLVT